MDSNLKLLYMDFPLQFLILCLLQFLQYTNTLNTTNYQNVVFNKCSNQTSNNLTHSALLPTLFQQFAFQSTQSKFFTTIVGDENAAITGTFQCRNDLSPEECKKCVSKFSNVSQELCGETLPARIQLSGCYAHYQEDWAFTQPDSEPSYEPHDQILHKKCSKNRVRGDEFEEIMNAALSELAVGVMRGEGFCEMTYETAYVMAQCEGYLGGCDCAECVSSAVQIVEEECRHSVTGEVYLDRCFISYKYYAHEGEYEDDGSGNRSPKLVAIVVGGLAAFFLGLGLCCFLRSCGKKKDDW